VDYAGIDLCGPAEKFSVAAYLDAVKPAFETGREIIVTGGTGLYVKCLTEGFDEVPPGNEKLRAELEAFDVAALAERARQEAPERYAGLTEDDRRNPRRLIRILEKASGGTGSVPSMDDTEVVPPSRSWNSKPRPTLLGLHVERAELHQRIEERVDHMYAAGLLDEARALIDLDLSPTALQAIGYAEAFAVLRHEMTLAEAREKTIIRTRQLAKRQMTWFRNQLQVDWIDTAQFSSLEKLAEAVSSAWKRIGPTKIEI
jgi:tRNA dimethylallyltransferase